MLHPAPKSQKEHQKNNNKKASSPQQLSSFSLLFTLIMTK